MGIRIVQENLTERLEKPKTYAIIGKSNQAPTTISYEGILK
jgi:hypothetical protein